MRNFIIVFIFSLMTLYQNAAGGGFSPAFYYGQSVPVAELSGYSDVIIKPNGIKDHDIEFLKRAGVTLFAYVSISEAAPHQLQTFSRLHAAILSKNHSSHGNVMDLRSDIWRDYLIDHVIFNIVSDGFDGIYLDDLEHFNELSPDMRPDQKSALITLLDDITSAYPELKLFLNKGFEIYSEVSDLIHAVAVDGFFSGWDEREQRYVLIDKTQRDEILEKLRPLKRHRIPVVVVDYVDPAHRKKAHEIVEKIRALGHTPYVTTPNMDAIGFSTLKLIPRRLLLLYNSDEGDLLSSDVHTMVALIAEYLGYLPEYHDIKKGTPTDAPVNRYAGMVIWTGLNSPDSNRWHSFFEKANANGVPLIIMENFSFFGPDFLKNLDLSFHGKVIKPFSLIHQDKSLGSFEGKLRRYRSNNTHPKYNGEGEPFLSLKDTAGNRMDPVTITSWGGYVLAPYIYSTAPSGRRRWLFNPFKFFSSALKRTPFPIPDPTTENGRRIVTAHIKDDGFCEKSESGNELFCAEVIADKILNVYDIPHTITGIHSNSDGTFSPLAQLIITHPNVEVADDTDIHPLNKHLRHIHSHNETNQRVPDDGFTKVTKAFHSLSQISPYGHKAKEGWHIYAPVLNENAYTNGWQGPFYGYQRVIETFQLTESPRRFKPISISYHFYSGCKQASLNALKKVYEWTMDQNGFPLRPHQLRQKIQGFYNTAIHKRNNTWIITGLGTLRTLRLPKSLGWPNLEKSKGIAGYKETPLTRYLNLKAESVRLVLQNKPPSQVFLEESNAGIVSFKYDLKDEKRINLRLKGDLPVEFTLKGGASCALYMEDLIIFPRSSENRTHRFFLKTKDLGDAYVICKDN